jgi:hypothetical protein
MAEYPDHITYQYAIRVDWDGTKYRLLHYNSPWEDGERELEDIQLMLEGKDSSGKYHPQWHVVHLNKHPAGKYDLKVEMTLVKKDSGEFDQFFTFLDIQRAL